MSSWGSITAESLPVQMMLTWSLADALRRKIDSGARIDHWAAGLSHGLAVRSSTRNVSVTIGYHGVITFWDDADHLPQISNVWDVVPFDALNGAFVSHLAGQLPKSDRPVEATDRAAERGNGYGCVAALLRLSAQRGFGWRCDTALDDEGWGPIRTLLLPYPARVGPGATAEYLSS